MSIADNITKIKKGIPSNVVVIAATKKRSSEEIIEATKAGITCIGENYVQEIAQKYNDIKDKVEIHCIGHLQRNKVKKAVELFDMIQTVDSKKIAVEINKRCEESKKIMSVLIEVNSAKEENKTGCMPEEVRTLAKEIVSLKNLELRGLMTMGPSVSAEELRPYFKETKQLFEKLRKMFPIDILSMGMSDSYKVAIEEGSTMVRLGTVLFGER